MKIKSIALLLLAISISCQNAFADFFSSEDFKVALGAQGNSSYYKRGIFTYEGYQAVPIYAVQLFNPDLLLAGSALYYTSHISQNFLLRSRLNFDSTQDKPLYYTNEKENDRVRRKATNELDLDAEYRFDDDSFLRLHFSQDLLAHHGQYFEVRGRLALFDLLKKGDSKALIQPGLFTAFGFGDKRHNSYLYGAGANSGGANNIEYGLSVTSPKVIDIFWPTLIISRFHLLGGSNQSGSYVQETSGWSAQVLCAFRVW